MSWEIKKLNECCISITDGDHLPPPKSETGVPFVTIANVDSYNHFDFTDTMFVPQSYYDKLDDKRKARKGDILLTVVGSFGIPILITDDTPFVFQRHIAILRPNPEVIDSRFLYYTMMSKSFYAQADAYAIGAAQRTISLTSLRRMKIAVPDLETQRKIADTLAPFDSLIDSNNKQIKILEQMAENLYKEWFVRFRFPGYETADFENGIPVEWEYVKLSEKLNFERGVGYSSADLTDSNNVLLSMNNIRPWGGFIRDYSRKYAGKFKEFQVVKQHDLIMSITDMTQDRRIIGYVGLIPHSEQTRIICTHLMKITAINSEYDNVFLYGLFNFSGLSRCISERATGANVLGLTANILNNVKWYFPTLDLIRKYCAVAKPLYEAIEQYEEQNENLAKQRNLLLPRLMSGKLEV